MDFFFPIECVACGTAGSLCCPSCAAAVPMSPVRLEEDGLKIAAAYAYAQPVVRRLIHDLKYERWTAAAVPMGTLARRWAAKSGAAFCGEDAILVPVPLSDRRRRTRGFNQAVFLAEAMAWALGLRRSEDLIVRRRDTRPQTSIEDRAANVEGAFIARLPARWRARTIVLVDDVVTTGSTMRACAAALTRAGACEVRGFALAWGSLKKIDGNPGKS